MWCLAFRVLHLLSGWGKVCLRLDYHCEWRGVVKFDICASLSRGWYFRDQWSADLCSGRVRLSTQSSENLEPDSVLPMETLLKPVGFIVLTSTGEFVFSIPNFLTRARDVEVSNFVRGAAVSTCKNEQENGRLF